MIINLTSWFASRCVPYLGSSNLTLDSRYSHKMKFRKFSPVYCVPFPINSSKYIETFYSKPGYWNVTTEKLIWCILDRNNISKGACVSDLKVLSGLIWSTTSAWKLWPLDLPTPCATSRSSQVSIQKKRVQIYKIRFYYKFLVTGRS